MRDVLQMQYFVLMSSRNLYIVGESNKAASGNEGSKQICKASPDRFSWSFSYVNEQPPWNLQYDWTDQSE